MTSSNGLRLERRPSSVTSNTGASDAREVLAVLGDEDAQQLLACSNLPLLVSEFATRCSLPISTTYRKIDQLQKAGLIEESIRFSADGKHAAEYQLAVPGVDISLQNGIRVRYRSR